MKIDDISALLDGHISQMYERYPDDQIVCSLPRRSRATIC